MTAATTTTTFTTPRLFLRHVEARDLDALVELDSDPEVMRFISGGEANTRADYEDRLLPRMTAYAGQPVGYFSALLRGEFIGWFHLRPSVFDPEVLELGYRLARRAWGRGLATEGCRALIIHAFDTLGVEAVDACAMPDNAASIAVMRKFGLRLVGESAHPLAPGLRVVRYLADAAQFEATRAELARP